MATARKFSGRFARDESGAVIILVGLVIIVLALFAGIAFDSARGYLLKSKLSGALDAAGLAGGRVMTLSDAERDADINAYFAANFPPGFMGATLPPLTISENAEGDTLTVTANATVGTTLMRLLGINDMTVAARAVIKRQVRGLEVVMVLDNTYSMNGTKISDLRTAATTLVNILYGAEETIPNLWVGLVPFVHSVNVGNTHTSWLVPKPVGAPSFPHVDQAACTADDHNVAVCEQRLTSSVTHFAGGPADYSLYYYDSALYDGSVFFGPASPQIKWKGCVEARIRPDDGSDYTDKAEDPPSVRAFRPYFYPESRVKTGGSSTKRDNVWVAGSSTGDGNTSGGKGPNIGCASEIQPLTASKTTITDAISGMTVWNYGGTAIKLGLAWGWRAISPLWAGLWDGDPNKPLAYDAPLMDKAIILLTDGQHYFYNQGSHPNQGYNSHGRLAWGRLHDADGVAITSSGNPGPATQELDRRFSILCENIKAKGIKLYTIMLEISDPDLADLFRDCATKPEYYFESPSSSQLEAVFEAIANDLAQLRVAE